MIKLPFRGINLEPKKEPAFSRDLLYFTPNEKAVIPLKNNINENTNITVKKGDRVKVNSPLSFYDDGKVAVTSSVSGIVDNIKEIYLPTHGYVDSATIIPDKKQNEEAIKKGLSDCIAIADEANIIDSIGQLRLSDKLTLIKQDLEAGDSHSKVLYIWAVEDECYSSSLSKLLSEKFDIILDAAKLLKEQLALEKIVIMCSCFDKFKLKHHSDDGIHIKSEWKRYPVIRGLKAKIPTSYIIGLSAVYALARYIKKGEAQTDVVVTVAGNCIGNPQNIVTPVGTPVGELLNRCGLIKEPDYIVLGDCVSGVSVPDRDIPLTKGISCILAIKSEKHHVETPCIACGRCTKICPAGLMPEAILRAYLQKDEKDVRFYKPENCIGCNCCTYTCPSKIDVAGQILEAAKMIKPKEAENDAK